MDLRNQILAYAQEKYGTEPDQPWPAYPENQVLRHRDSGKWFALLMTLPREKLGIPGQGRIPVINLKGDVFQIEALRNERGFYPAYHMNKTHWLSIALDGQVPLVELLSFLDMSWQLTR